MRYQSTRARTSFVLAVALACFLTAGTTFGQDVVKVVENWEMIVASTDATTAAPQLNTVMSPFPHVDSYYGLLTINYRDLPDFVAGGLQSQLWEDRQPLGYVNDKVTSALSSNNETLTWQQTLEINSGKLSFHAQNGVSISWGKFADKTHLYVEQKGTNVVNLNGYTPNISVQYTRRWGLERHRISSLRITSITKTLSDGTVLTDSTPILVLPQ